MKGCVHLFYAHIPIFLYRGHIYRKAVCHCYQHWIMVVPRLFLRKAKVDKIFGHRKCTCWKDLYQFSWQNGTLTDEHDWLICNLTNNRYSCSILEECSYVYSTNKIFIASYIVQCTYSTTILSYTIMTTVHT